MVAGASSLLRSARNIIRRMPEAPGVGDEDGWKAYLHNTMLVVEGVHGIDWAGMILGLPEGPELRQDCNIIH